MAISSRCPSIAETIVADSSFSGLEFLGAPAFSSPSRVDSHHSKWFHYPSPLAGIQIQPIIATSIALR
jgi:hypothetical protein